MKHRFQFLLGLSLVLVMVLAACGGTPATEEPAATEAPAAEEPAATEAPATEEEPVEEPMAMPGEGTTVRLGRATWDTGWFQAAIYSNLLQELGYDVSAPNDLTPEIFYVALANGELDFWANGWFPIHNTFVQQEDVAGKVELVGYQVKAGALQGYLVDKKTADEMGIVSLEDFKNPEVAALFDGDGNGKADLIGCNPGWGCEKVIEHHLDAYELRESIDHIQGEYSALMADTIARYKRGEPVLFYTWTPNWTIAELAPGEDVVWIEVPFSSLPEDQKDMEDMTVGDGIIGCVADPCNIGFPPNDIRVVANAEFLASDPAAQRLFELVEVPLQDIADQNTKMLEGEDSDDDIARHVQEWIDANRAQIDEWLNEARAAGA